jgi:hypothetical protein
MQTKKAKKEKRRIYHAQYYIDNREKVKTHVKQYRAENKEKVKTQRHGYYMDNRVEIISQTAIAAANRLRKKKTLVFKHYGPRCKWCGETNPLFLQLDHTNSDGSAHRDTLRGKMLIWTWIIKNNYPKGFQVLCANCHFAKSQYERSTQKRPVTATTVFGAARARQMARRKGSK